MTQNRNDDAPTESAAALETPPPVKAEAAQKHGEEKPQAVEAIARPAASKATLDRIMQVVPRIPVGRLKMMLADGNVTSAEARAALLQAGLSEEEIDAGLEDARRVMLSYARQVVPPEEQERMSGLATVLRQKVERMGCLLKAGLISPLMKKKDASLAHRASDVYGMPTQGISADKAKDKGGKII